MTDILDKKDMREISQAVRVLLRNIPGLGKMADAFQDSARLSATMERKQTDADALAAEIERLAAEVDKAKGDAMEIVATATAEAEDIKMEAQRSRDAAAVDRDRARKALEEAEARAREIIAGKEAEVAKTIEAVQHETSEWKRQALAAKEAYEVVRDLANAEQARLDRLQALRREMSELTAA